MATKAVLFSLLITFSIVFSDKLSDDLMSFKFYNSGTVFSDQSYTAVNIPCLYLEPENVTRAPYAWALTGTCPYLYQEAKPNIPPPVGVRSAVPLGGIAAGSIELRATGELHSWTILNQSPGGSAKFGVVNQAFFGARIENQKEGSVNTKALRTHSPLPGVIAGVNQIHYGGAYPVSRLDFNSSDFGVPLSLFGYSRYRVGDMETSSVPAIAFTLVVDNTGSSEINASFYFNLPFGIEEDYQRISTNVVASLNLDSPIKCAAACQQQSSCLSWNYVESKGKCVIQSDVPLSTYAGKGTSSGLKGLWSNTMQNNTMCLTYTTLGTNEPTQGAISICANIGDLPTFITSNDNGDTYNYFSNHGVFPSNFENINPFGAAAVTANVAPGTSRSLTLTLSWYYPNRDYVTQVIGNYYTNLFSSSTDAAQVLLSSLEETISDIKALHVTFFDSSLPTFLSDMYINSLSHIRSAFWLKDGRWRQWEAYDCVNIDSVHNDGERHIPYIMFFPQSTINKMRAWAKGQLNNGMIQEQLACGCTDGIDPNFDGACGRVMSDVSSMFIVYLYELYTWGAPGADQLLQELWPNAKMAAQWHIGTAQQFGIPYRLVNTYDILGLDQYNVSTYNSVFHILGLKAAEQLALTVGDNAFATVCNNAITVAQKALDTLLYNQTTQYYNAYWGLPPGVNARYTPGAIMTDSFYGQVLGYTVGLGTLISDSAKLLSHLNGEMKYNKSPYGLLVMTGRYPYPGPWTDNAVWMMGNPNWATLNIYLANNPTPGFIEDTLQVSAQTLDNWRNNLNDIWNVAGITGGIGYGAEGQPYITSHYGYFMSCWHTIFALSGQQANMPKKTLSFNPKIKNANLPILLPGVLGTLQDSDNSFTISLVFGQLNLDTLQLGNTICHRVNIKAGSSFTCVK